MDLNVDLNDMEGIAIKTKHTVKELKYLTSLVLPLLKNTDAVTAENISNSIVNLADNMDCIVKSIIKIADKNEKIDGSRD